LAVEKISNNPMVNFVADNSWLQGDYQKYLTLLANQPITINQEI
jgi:hypothetical protein